MKTAPVKALVVELPAPIAEAAGDAFRATDALPACQLQQDVPAHPPGRILERHRGLHEAAKAPLLAPPHVGIAIPDLAQCNANGFEGGDLVLFVLPGVGGGNRGLPPLGQSGSGVADRASRGAPRRSERDDKNASQQAQKSLGSGAPEHQRSMGEVKRRFMSVRQRG
jgi:hypothetical protein